MIKRRILVITFFSLAFLWALFIWSNSLKPGNVSGEMSGSVLRFINDILGNISPNLTLSHLFVRKMAHFLEFAVLSVLFCLSCYFLFAVDKTINKSLFIFISLPASFMVAAIDETIQLFVEGRAGKFTDVLIDTSGALCAVLIFFLVVCLKNKLHRKTPAT